MAEHNILENGFGHAEHLRDLPVDVGAALVDFDLLALLVLGPQRLLHRFEVQILARFAHQQDLFSDDLLIFGGLEPQSNVPSDFRSPCNFRIHDEALPSVGRRRQRPCRNVLQALDDGLG